MTLQIVTELMFLEVLSDVFWPISSPATLSVRRWLNIVLTLVTPSRPCSDIIASFLFLSILFPAFLRLYGGRDCIAISLQVVRYRACLLDGTGFSGSIARLSATRSQHVLYCLVDRQVLPLTCSKHDRCKAHLIGPASAVQCVFFFI